MEVWKLNTNRFGSNSHKLRTLLEKKQSLRECGGTLNAALVSQV